MTETSTYNTPTYAQLPYSRVLISGNYTLPAYTQDVWDRTRDVPSVSFVVVLQNNNVNLVTVSPGTNWVGGSFQISGGCCSLMLVLDNGQTATMCPIGSAAAMSGSFTVTTAGPLVATSPVTLGGNLDLNNTALDSVYGTSWRAGSTSSVNLSANNVAVGHGSSAISNSSALGFQASANTNSVAVGAQANSTGQGEITIGYQATSQLADSITIGRQASAIGASSIAIGGGASASADSATGVGTGVQALGVDSTAVGRNAFGNTNGTAMGRDVTAGIDGTSLGGRSLARTSGVSVGYQAVNSGVQAVNVGRGSTAADDGTSVGYLANASASATAVGSGAVANATNAAAIGKGVNNSTAWSTLIGYSDTGTSNIHEVRSSGLLKSTFQVACSLYSDAISYNANDPYAAVGSWLTTFDYPYDRLAPPFIGPFGTNIQLKTPNSVYLVAFFVRGPRNADFSSASGSMSVNLNYYNSATVAVSQLCSVYTFKPSWGEATTTGTALVQTSSNVGDYVYLSAQYVYLSGSVYADYKIFVARIA